MTRILIPRESTGSAKTVDASDWIKYHKFLNNYVVCGFAITAQCPNILAVDVAAGTSRLCGLYVENSTCCSVTCLTAGSCNYIYATVTDVACEPSTWAFSQNTTGCTPSQSLLLAVVTTDCCCTVTAVCQSIDVIQNTSGVESDWIWGTGKEGCVTIACNTSICSNHFYRNLTINACTTLSMTATQKIINVQCTLTVNGTRSLVIKYVMNSTEGQVHWLEIGCVEGDSEFPG